MTEPEALVRTEVVDRDLQFASCGDCYDSFFPFFLSLHCNLLTGPSSMILTLPFLFFSWSFFAYMRRRSGYESLFIQQKPAAYSRRRNGRSVERPSDGAGLWAAIVLDLKKPPRIAEMLVRYWT